MAKRPVLERQLQEQLKISRRDKSGWVLRSFLLYANIDETLKEVAHQRDMKKELLVNLLLRFGIVNVLKINPATGEKIPISDDLLSTISPYPQFRNLRAKSRRGKRMTW